MLAYFLIYIYSYSKVNFLKNLQKNKLELI